MGKVKVLNKKEKLAFAVVAALAMTSGGFAFGQSVNNVSSDQVIYACVTGVNGNITKVSNTPKTCPRGTSPISWNMVGPKGEQGLPGVKGEKGDLGASEITPSTKVVYKGLVEYQSFTTPDGLLATLVDGKIYRIGNDNFALSSFDRDSSFRDLGYFYSDPNCLGDKRLVSSAMTDPRWVLGKRVSSGLENPDGNADQAIILSDLGNFNQVSVRSFYRPENRTCYSINKADLVQRRETVYTSYLSKIREIIPLLKSGETWLSVNPGDCTIEGYYSAENGTIEVNEIIPNCTPSNFFDRYTYQALAPLLGANVEDFYVESIQSAEVSLERIIHQINTKNSDYLFYSVEIDDFYTVFRQNKSDWAIVVK